MEPAYIYYKKLVADKENIFAANIAEKNEVENVKFSKFYKYGVTGMTIIPDIKDSSILKVTNEKKLKALSEKMQEIQKYNNTFQKKIRGRLSSHKTNFLKHNHLKNRRNCVL